MEELHNIILELKAHYEKRVPNGFSFVGKSYGGNFLTVGLISDLNDCSSRIRDNDIGIGGFAVTLDGENLILTQNLRGHRISCIPEIKYHALSLRKVSFRKIKAKDVKSLVEKFDKYLVRYLTYVLELKVNNEIYNQSKYDEKYFQFNLSDLKELKKVA